MTPTPIEKEFEARLSTMEDSRVYDLHIPVPVDISDHFKNKGLKRFICTVDGILKKHSALMPMGDGTFYVLLNQGDAKELRAEVGQIVRVRLAPDKSRYGMDMPEEFAELLVQDGEGDRYFHALTPGKQRNLIHLVATLKSTDARIRKAIGIVDYLHSSGGALDFRELLDSLKKKR